MVVARQREDTDGVEALVVGMKKEKDHLKIINQNLIFNNQTYKDMK